MEFIYNCRRLNSKYLGPLKAGPPKMRGPPRLRVLRGWFLRHCLAVFDKIYIYRHGGLVVRAFALQSEDLGSSLVESD